MSRYGWARWGDVNAFFGLMLDNVAVMVLLVGTIALPLAHQKADDPHFTPAFVLTRMIPGTAIGVLLGDLVYTWLAFRLARRTGRSDVTAMPLGLDTPSTFGISLFVLLPALREGILDLHLSHQAGMEFAWRVGVVVLLLSGVFKLLCAPFGNAVRRLVPQAGLLGSLAAIALALIAFLPLLVDGVAAVPLVGMLALAVILVTLVAHQRLPGNIPGALAAVVLGVGFYLVADKLGGLLHWPLVPAAETSGVSETWQPPALFSALGLGYDHWSAVWVSALAKLPIALPFALATVVGGIDCTESAAVAGDEYDTRTILLTEAVAAVAAGGLGGVIQTVPYIGHPAYKTMGGRGAYTLASISTASRSPNILPDSSTGISPLARRCRLLILVLVKCDSYCHLWPASCPGRWPLFRSHRQAPHVSRGFLQDQHDSPLFCGSCLTAAREYVTISVHEKHYQEWPNFSAGHTILLGPPNAPATAIRGAACLLRGRPPFGRGRTPFRLRAGFLPRALPPIPP